MSTLHFGSAPIGYRNMDPLNRTSHGITMGRLFAFGFCYLVNKYAVNVPFWDDWAQMISYAKQRLSGYQGFEVMLQ